MKKEEITGLVVYILALGFAIIFGLTVLKNHSTESYILANSGMLGYMAFMLVAIVLGVVINGVIVEVAHVIGAKIGGYGISKINILGFNFVKDENLNEGKFSSFTGLTGETKIYPLNDFKDKKGNKKEPSPYAYLWFGTIFIVIEIVIVMILFSLLNQDSKSLLSDIAYMILTIGMIGFMILIYNILPFKLDTPTDGYRLTLVSNPKNKEAFNELLRVERANETGEKVEIKTFTEITNFTADLNLNKVYQLLDEGKFDEAETLIDMIIDAGDSVSPSVHISARSQKIYIHLMNKPIEEATAYYEANVPHNERRLISDDVSMPSIRAYLLMAGLIDKSKSECLLTLQKVIKAYKKTPKTRQPVEVKLFNETLQKIIEAHPKWGLEGYILAIK